MGRPWTAAETAAWLRRRKFLLRHHGLLEWASIAVAWPEVPPPPKPHSQTSVMLGGPDSGRARCIGPGCKGEWRFADYHEAQGAMGRHALTGDDPYAPRPKAAPLDVTETVERSAFVLAHMGKPSASPISPPASMTVRPSARADGKRKTK